MYIRTQNAKRILQCVAVGVEECKIVGKDITGDVCTLARYSSKEHAMRALNCVQMAIINGDKMVFMPKDWGDTLGITEIQDI